MILILAIAILGVSAMVSVKMRMEKRRKWWLPFIIGGMAFGLMICLFIAAFNTLTLSSPG